MIGLRWKTGALMGSLLLAGLVWSDFAAAGEIELKRATMAAGGGIGTSGGSIKLSGTVGQWDGSPRRAFDDGRFALTSGFWAASSVQISAPDAPWPGGLTGTWYDPDTDGQGFNLQVLPSGIFGYFYGYHEGERMWLVFDTHFGSFDWDQTVEIDLLVGSQGTFGNPVAPENGGVEPWGTVELAFHSCNSATAELTGNAGSQSFDLTMLAPVDGYQGQCVGAPESSDLADLSGAWYDPSTSGQGWNFVATAFGLLGYFYGYTAGGEPLWLYVANLPTEIQAGEPVMLDLVSAPGGTFTSPVPPADLEDWGQAEVTFHSCREATIEVVGEDGSQVQNLEMLAPTAGLEDCQI